MDIDYYEDGKHSGSGLGTSDNGPVPAPSATGGAAYAAATSGGTPVESDTKIDGLADSGFDANGADSAVEAADFASSSPDSIAQPASGQAYPTGTTYPR